MRSLLKIVPIPLAGLALGFAAFGNLLPQTLWPIHILCGVVAALLLVLLVGRVLLFPDDVRSDLHNPLLASVSATFMMALMQLATYLAVYAYDAARILWMAAVALHLVLMIGFSIRFLPRHQMDDVYPTWFIAYVGIVVASVTSPTFAAQQVGLILFWVGVVLYIALLVVVTLRCVRKPLSSGARPTLCVYAAPMSLCLTGYLSVCEVPSVPFVLVLLAFAQGLLVFVLLKLPRLLQLPFYPSYAAMTFPLVISATAFGKALSLFGSQGLLYPPFLDTLVVVEMMLAAAMLLYVLVRYVRYLYVQASEEVRSVVGEDARVI